MKERTEVCDFICIGGGLGGLAGAIRASHLGLKTVVLERSPLLGGVAAYSGGTIWAPGNHLAAFEGDRDSLGDAWTYLDSIGPSGVPFDSVLRRRFLEALEPSIRFYSEQAGIRFSVTGRPDHFFPSASGSNARGRALEVHESGSKHPEVAKIVRVTPHFRYRLTHKEILDNGGPAFAYQRLRALEQRREEEDYRALGPGLALGFARAAIHAPLARIRRNARVKELLVRDGRVVGARAQIDGETLLIEARRGVLLASGSYGGSDWAASFEGLPEIVEGSPPIVDGDSLSLLAQVPAAIGRAGRPITALGFLPPGYVHAASSDPLCLQLSLRSTALPHSVVVNSRGERFADESFYRLLDRNVKAYDSVSEEFTNYPCFMIFDDQFRRKYSLTPSGEWPDGIPSSTSVAELAVQLGINSQGLVATVRRFNTACESGNDIDFGRGETPQGRAMGDPNAPRNPNLGPLATPPFWGIRLYLMGTGVYSMGALIDSEARVLDYGGNAIPGFYATGNAVCYAESHGYTGGQANARNIAFSYLAATHAAE